MSSASSSASGKQGTRCYCLIAVTQGEVWSLPRYFQLSCDGRKTPGSSLHKVIGVFIEQILYGTEIVIYRDNPSSV